VIKKTKETVCVPADLESIDDDNKHAIVLSHSKCVASVKPVSSSSLLFVASHFFELLHQFCLFSHRKRFCSINTIRDDSTNTGI
jgi:hypothetical protein